MARRFPARRLHAHVDCFRPATIRLERAVIRQWCGQSRASLYRHRIGQPQKLNGLFEYFVTALADPGNRGGDPNLR